MDFVPETMHLTPSGGTASIVIETGSGAAAAAAAAVSAAAAAASAAAMAAESLNYRGAWNASTNTPTLADGTGTAGDFYEVSAAGTRSLGSGSIAFVLGDFVVYDGAVWARTPMVATAPTADEAGLKIVRGIVNTAGSGSIVAGSGFSITRNNTGDLTVTFTTPFSGVPAVTFGAQGDGAALGPIVSRDDATVRTAGSFRVEIVKVATGFVDGIFDFIACGPR